LKLQEAEALAFKILQVIEPCCERVSIAGSVRRRRPEPNDIDIVLIPKPFMWTQIEMRMRAELGAMRGIAGTQLIRIYIPFANVPERHVQVDFYAATEQTWGTILLIRTGSTDHNIRLCTHAKALDMMLSASRGVIEKGKVVASKTEEEIFKALILPYVAPGDREV